MGNTYSSDGNKNLLALQKADNFTNWMYSEVKPYLFGNILEAGSGVGTYSEKLARDFGGSKIILSDIDAKYIASLKKRFRENKSISCIKLDISNLADFKKIRQKVDSVLALNVLEHVGDDVGAMKNVYGLLQGGGRFVVLVPAHKFLYNCMDESLGHHRRYTKKEIIEKVGKTKFKIKKIFYFNFLSMLGWYLNGNVLKKTTLSEKNMGALNAAVPALKAIEKNILLKKIGLSLIVVLEKQN